MVATHRVNLPVAKGVTVETSPDGKQTALLFKTSAEPGFVGIALNNAELARTVLVLLSQAAKVAAKVAAGERHSDSSSAPERAGEDLRGDGGITRPPLAHLIPMWLFTRRSPAGSPRCRQTSARMHVQSGRAIAAGGS
jgi:hypothetical protein